MPGQPYKGGAGQKGARWDQLPVSSNDPVNRLSMQMDYLQSRVDKKLILDAPRSTYMRYMQENIDVECAMGKGARNNMWAKAARKDEVRIVKIFR